MEAWGPAARQVPPGRNLLTCILLRILSSRCSWRTHHNQDHGALLPLLMPTQNHFISYLKPDCVPLSLPTRALSSVLACTSDMLDMRAVCPSSGDYYTPPPTHTVSTWLSPSMALPDLPWACHTSPQAQAGISIPVSSRTLLLKQVRPGPLFAHTSFLGQRPVVP